MHDFGFGSLEMRIKGNAFLGKRQKEKKTMNEKCDKFFFRVILRTDFELCRFFMEDILTHRKEKC